MFYKKTTTWDLGVVLLASISVMAIGTSIGRADFTFGTPTKMGPSINSSGAEYVPCVSADGLEIYFQREEPDGEIYVARRPTPDSEWGEAVNLGPTINSPDYDGGASISADGLSLYFARATTGLFVAHRATVKDAWGTPVNLGPTVNAGGAFATSISADELELYFQSDRPGGYGGLDVWVTTRATVDDDWGVPVNLGPGINTSAWDNWPGISPDGLVLFFASNRSGGAGGWDLYMTRRVTKKDPWGPPMNLGPTVNGAASEVHSKVSYDGSMLYFCPFGLGESDDLWQAPVIPIVDFNADGKVDLVDLVMLIENWGSTKTLCDIGPMPWGDGKVDIEDLKVFMTYYEKENPPVKP
jgi:hypothetical protein